MHHSHRTRVFQVEQEVAVGHRVKRIRDNARKAQVFSHLRTVDGVTGTRQGRSPKGVECGLIVGFRDAIEVACKHPEVSQHVVAKQHRLGMLKMGITRHNDVIVVLGKTYQYALERPQRTPYFVCQIRRHHARVERHLVVAATTRMQACARFANAFGKDALNGHVNVFVDRRVYFKGTVVHTVMNGFEPIKNSLGVFGRNDALFAQHTRMRRRPRQVFMNHI